MNDAEIEGVWAEELRELLDKERLEELRARADEDRIDAARGLS